MTTTLSIGVLIACELFFRLPFAGELQSIRRHAASPLKVFRSKHSSDERKERLLLTYSFLLGRSSALLLCYLLLVAVPVLAAGYLEFGAISVALHKLSSASFLLFSIALAAGYAVMRRIVSNGKLFKAR